MKNPRRHASLRAPFISTFTAGAAAVILAGCGGAVITDPGADGGLREDRQSPPPGCPATAPASGSMCALGRDLACTYGSTTTPCGTNPTVYQCDSANRVWRAQISSCNPPSVVCPAALPRSGESCTPGWGNTCTYPAPGCNGVAQRHTATCDEARRQWSVDSPTCVAAVCPPTAPSPGQSCVISEATRSCRYPGMPCGTVTQEVFAQCSGATPVWQVSIASCNPPPPICPPSAPADGAGCIPSAATRNCSYSTSTFCGGTPNVHAMCTDAGRWSVSTLSCNPPPPPPDGGASDAGSPRPVDPDGGSGGAEPDA